MICINYLRIASMSQLSNCVIGPTCCIVRKSGVKIYILCLRNTDFYFIFCNTHQTNLPIVDSSYKTLIPQYSSEHIHILNLLNCSFQCVNLHRFSSCCEIEVSYTTLSVRCYVYRIYRVYRINRL